LPAGTTVDLVVAAPDGGAWYSCSAKNAIVHLNDATLRIYNLSLAERHHRPLLRKDGAWLTWATKSAAV
jgi:streptogramin lyase